jgi:chromosome segregation ATPase
MILSGPNSYSDEYLRKQGTGRTLHDPSSLLTDRGAYINFLETQLERVSAACLGAQSYDQRFNDLQGMLSSLEHRCGQTTRLLGLAQQCIEEIRSESDNKLVSILREVKDEHRDTQKAFEAMATRIAVAEQTLSSLAQVQPQLDVLARRMTASEAKTAEQHKLNDERHRANEGRAAAANAALDRTNADIATLNTALSKLALTAEENERAAGAALAAAEQRLTTALRAGSDDATRGVQELHAKMTVELDQARKEAAQQVRDVASDARHQFDIVMEKVETAKVTTAKAAQLPSCMPAHLQCTHPPLFPLVVAVVRPSRRTSWSASAGQCWRARWKRTKRSRASWPRKWGRWRTSPPRC